MSALGQEQTIDYRPWLLSSSRILFSGSTERSSQFSYILQFLKAADERHDALRTALADDRSREIREFAFERRTRERALRVTFGNFHCFVQRLTVCEGDHYASAAPFGDFGYQRSARSHGGFLHQFHDVPSAPAIFLELIDRHIAVEKSHGETDRKAVIGGTLCLRVEFRWIRHALDYPRIGFNRDRAYKVLRGPTVERSLGSNAKDGLAH